MKIVLLSDLHREIWKDRFPEINYGNPDIICFAGDIGNGVEPLEYMNTVKDQYGCQVVYVAGNHEFYGHEYISMMETLKNTADDNGIILLDNDIKEIDGFAFIGATCWTDYEVEVTYPPAIAMAAAEHGINDHYRIRWDSNLFRAAQALKMNKVSKNFIFDAISQYGRDSSIVVTHHAPTRLAIASQFVGSPMNGGFCNGWDKLIDEAGPKLWMFGHTHSDLDVMIGDTRIASRQLGYPGERRQTGQSPFEVMEFVI